MSRTTRSIEDLYSAVNMHLYRHYRRGEECDQLCIPSEVDRYLGTLGSGEKRLLLIVLLKDWVARVNLSMTPGGDYNSDE